MKLLSKYKKVSNHINGNTSINLEWFQYKEQYFGCSILSVRNMQVKPISLFVLP